MSANASKNTLKAKFLQEATLFRRLDPQHVKWLAGRLEERGVPAGTVVVRQGELDDCCYLVRTGEVEVTGIESDGTERKPAILGPGSLFGEAALINDALRDATVRALEQTELLVLRRDDMREATRAWPELDTQLHNVMRMRARPRRIPGIAMAECKTAAGESVTILIDRKRFSYFRLSPQGRFLWDRLDGRHTLRDLTVDYLYAFKSFSPQIVAQTLQALILAGFLEAGPMEREAAPGDLRVPWWWRAAARAVQILEWRVIWRGVDGLLTWIYDAGVRELYTVGGQALLALVTLGGLAAFFLSGARAGTSLQSCSTGTLLLFLLPAWLVSILLHEAGHAFTAKAVGCRVVGAGVGWYWFAPVAFIDTSDVWRADRRERIAVSLAGPYCR